MSLLITKTDEIMCNYKETNSELFAAVKQEAINDHYEGLNSFYSQSIGVLDSGSHELTNIKETNADIYKAAKEEAIKEYYTELDSINTKSVEPLVNDIQGFIDRANRNSDNTASIDKIEQARMLGIKQGLEAAVLIKLEN